MKLEDRRVVSLSGNPPGSSAAARGVMGPDRSVARGHPSIVLESVAMVHWPREHERRDRLARDGVPCLLLVAADSATPVVAESEDWIRLPADERDVSIRLQGLARRACRPELVDEAVLRNSLGTVALSPLESSLVKSLLRSDGRLVARRELELAIWPDGPPAARSLDDLVYRLRRRLKSVHLDVFRGHGRGFVLGVSVDVVESFDDSEPSDA